MLSQQIKDLIDYFDSIGPQFDLAFAPEEGTYYPASIKHLFKIFQELIKSSVISPNQTFLDAGSGDGRIVALASLLGFDAYGIELNRLIYESSLQIIEELVKKKIITKIPHLICGNIINSSSYTSLGNDFKNFHIIFNFNTLPYELLRKIEIESPINTIFIFNSISQILKVDQKFELVHKFDLTEFSQLLHIYKKCF
ncbi:MAG: hypothetical protein ACW99A_12420 [Candidatus Kariarchaeaceae archaeon]|jgi:hypothetical protein